MAHIKKPRLTSGALVVHEGKFLLAERNKKNYKGVWILPGGGVEFGETTEDAAAREIKEETNLDVSIVKFIGAKEIINIPGDYHSVVFYYLAEPKTTLVHAQEDVSSAKFFTIEEVKTMNIAESVKWVLQEAGFW